MSAWERLTPPYSTIVADPPWPYQDKPFTWRQEVGVDAFLPYSTMSVPDIAAVPVVDLAGPGSHLYVWTTNRHLWDARDIAMGWGFAVAQVLVWCKPINGIPVGTFNSNSTEFVLFCRRTIAVQRSVERAGRLIREARESTGLNRAELHRAVRGGTPTGIVARWEDDDSLPNEADWAALQRVLPALAEVERPYVAPPEPSATSRINTAYWNWPRGQHSAKPAAFLDLVEQVSPGPYVELFARAPRLGWDSWGHGYEMTGRPS